MKDDVLHKLREVREAFNEGMDEFHELFEDVGKVGYKVQLEKIQSHLDEFESLFTHKLDKLEEYCREL